MNNKYDEELAKIPFYSIHNEFLPFIGTDYEKYKVFIVGESHYIGQNPNSEKYNLSYFDENWWNGSCNELYNDYYDWFNTREVINNYLCGYRSRGHLIFTNIIKSFSQVILNEPIYSISIEESQKFNYLSFMNFFQMPSLYKGEKFWNSLDKSAKKSNDSKLSIKVWNKTVEESAKVLDDVIDIIQPKVIVFSSASAYDAYIKSNHKYSHDLNIIKIPHAGCRWWNTKCQKYGNVTGKELFEKLLYTFYEKKGIQ